ncbi:MAG: imelysin family protein [Pseudomonadota bacterium]
MRLATIMFAVMAGVGLLATAPAAAAAPKVSDVIKTYADMAQAKYEDALTAAKAMQSSVGALLEKPTLQTLAAARSAWIDARVPYQQTEVYRFGNRIVDDWEGKVNAWPLDEGLIDYVKGEYGDASEENDLYAANIIANPKLRISGREVDATKITKELLSGTLHEAGGVEANVATGYHAVEFLLWGQDLNGTRKGAGNRPATDFSLAACTNGNCDRRRDYLRVATDLLVDDLAWIAKQWGADGAARKALTDGNPNAGLTAIFTGLGSLSYGELAGERMKLGLLLNDPEEEHDCFADNTHNSHYYNVVGIQNVYLGRYKRTDGSIVSGPSVSDLVMAKSAETDGRVRTALQKSMQAFTALKTRAETVEAYDQMLGEGNSEGNAVVQRAIDVLIAQTKEFERAITSLDLGTVAFEGSDSLDDPAKVLQ